MKYLFFDVETTGLDPQKNAIIQLSGIIDIDGEIKEEFDFRIKPFEDSVINQSSLDFLGFTKEHIMNYPEPDIQFNKFVNILNKYVKKFDRNDKFFLVGYNSQAFDMPYLRKFFLDNSKTAKDYEYGNGFGSYFYNPTLDVMILQAMYNKNNYNLTKEKKLFVVCKSMGMKIDEEKLHDALYDVRITRELFYKINKENA